MGTMANLRFERARILQFLEYCQAWRRCRSVQYFGSSHPGSSEVNLLTYQAKTFIVTLPRDTGDYSDCAKV